MRAKPGFPADRRRAGLSLAAVLGCAVAAWTGSAAASNVYRCETAAGKVVFTDAPCKGDARGSAWAAAGPAPGIAASSGTRGMMPASHAVLRTPPAEAAVGRSEPWVDCRQRGGQFDAGARVCRLPPDTVQHMFRAD